MPKNKIEQVTVNAMIINMSKNLSPLSIPGLKFMVVNNVANIFYAVLEA
jgi:hypothetical protein